MSNYDCNEIADKQQKINSMLKQCRAHAAKSSTNKEQFIAALKTLYHELYQLSVNQSVGIFRQSVSEYIIYKMDRVIISLDEEIEGPFAHENYSHDWKDIGNTNIPSEDVQSDPERWIDKCLDLCGYGISLEVAVDCLRKVMRESNKAPEQGEIVEAKTSLSAVVTSLRTIRRRLLASESVCASEHLVGVLNTYRFGSIPGAHAHAHELTTQDAYVQCLEILLPLEYYENSQQIPRSEKEFLLSDSLVLLATSVVPALVSSACHAMQLPLPMWASKESISHLLISAFRISLAANNFKEVTTPNSSLGEPPENDKINAAASEYFQGLLRHAIIERDGAAAIKLLYQVFALQQTTSMDACAIIHSHLIDVLGSTPAKREVALFVRALVRYVVSKNKSKLLAQVTSANGQFIESELDSVCKDEVLPILEYFLEPLLARDNGLVEAVIDFTILSPPSSFKKTGPEQLSLHLCDQLIPRCIVIMLHLISCGGRSKPSDSESADAPFLRHLSTVAAVWCEEIFVSKTAILQQQYVTEFLLYPLQNQITSREKIELGLDSTGISLAIMLIQGVSFRLEVSRAEAIRRDGMRVAEAMARIFGQSLRFDELHSPEESDKKPKATAPTVPKKKSKRKTLKQASHPPKIPVVVDPDAEVFSDDSDDESDESCSKSDQSSYDSEQNSDESSWGEDSLEPYEMDDDEEDLRRVPRPRSLRDCVAYLLTNHEVREAYDKHEAALQELPELVSSKPLDVMDVLPTLVRVLLHMEDKFNMIGFLQNRYDSLMACALQAPVETCFKLVEEMKGHVSLGTRLEALSIIRNAVEELSGHINHQERISEIKCEESFEMVQMSTRLRKSLALQEECNDGALQQKTRRWKSTRPANSGKPNTFNSVSAQMMLPLFAFIAQTKGEDAIWGGSLGERLLSELLRTLSVMVNCARTYPSSRVFASDLLQLAWSFRDAKNTEVKRSVLIAMSTSISVDPVGQSNNINALVPFLTDCSFNDADGACREIALSIVGTISNAYQHQMIM